MKRKVVTLPSILMMVMMSLLTALTTNKMPMNRIQVERMTSSIRMLYMFFLSVSLMSSMLMSDSITKQMMFVKAQKISIWDQTSNGS